MVEWDGETGVRAAELLLLGGVAAMYLSSRIAVKAVGGAGDGDTVGNAGASPGWRAIAHWSPIAAFAIVATVWGRSDVALAIIFATSVGALTLATGCSSFVEPDIGAPPRSRRIWPFVLPAAALALLPGFSGQFTSFNSLVLAIEGWVVLRVWHDRAGLGEGAPQSPPPVERLNFALSVVLAIVGSIWAMKGMMVMQARTNLSSVSVAADLTVAPLLVVPMLISGSELARGRGPAAAASGHVAIVLLNLCVLLPVVGLLSYVNWINVVSPLLSNAMAGTIWSTTTMEFPTAVWRLDGVLLVVLGMMLAVMGWGRWRLGRREGVGLVLAYGFYVIATVWASLL